VCIQVFEEYMTFVLKYSSLVERLPTRAFLTPLSEDEEVEIELARGVGINIKYKAVGELQASGERRGVCVCELGLA
jgi:pyruvate carboxylase